MGQAPTQLAGIRPIRSTVRLSLMCKHNAESQPVDLALLMLGAEEIAYAPFCVYILRITRARLNFFTQSSHMHIHRADIPAYHGLVSPYILKQGLTAVDLIRICDKKFQQVEFLRGQVDLLIFNEDSAALPVKL